MTFKECLLVKASSLTISALFLSGQLHLPISKGVSKSAIIGNFEAALLSSMMAFVNGQSCQKRMISTAQRSPVFAGGGTSFFDWGEKTRAKAQPRISLRRSL